MDPVGGSSPKSQVRNFDYTRDGMILCHEGPDVCGTRLGSYDFTALIGEGA